MSKHESHPWKVEVRNASGEVTFRKMFANPDYAEEFARGMLQADAAENDGDLYDFLDVHRSEPGDEDFDNPGASLYS